MATRRTRLVIKNNSIPSAPFSGATLLQAEPIVNTADGIMMFSGVTQSTSEWTPAGTGGNSTFFEVGSNLYDLRLRNRITKYEGTSGAGLVGKFLSGTTNGFVLADISDLDLVDTYVTGFTYSPSTNLLTIKRNQGEPDLTAYINEFSGITITGILSATTANINTANVTTINATGGTITTLNSTTANIGTENVTTLNATGGTINTLTTTTINSNTISANTISATTFVGTDYYINGGIQSYSGQTDLSGLFLSGTSNGFALGAMSAITGIDTFTTGFTYNPATNTFTINRNLGQPDLTATLTTVTGLTVSNLTSGRVVFVGSGGLLTDEAGFTYDAGTNTLSIPSDGTMNVGTGGLNVVGDTVIQGSLTVFGASVSAFTSQLYVEDPNVIFNYNPTGSTIATSLGAGLTIQDGNGVTGGSVNLEIRALNTLTGLTPTEIPDITEYTSATGFANRGWVTQLNDIILRSTDTTIPNGVRVICEWDILDGGLF